VLGVGLDWAENLHDVALGRPGQGVIEQFRIDHGPSGVDRLIAKCIALEPDPAEIRVVLETRHGLLVEALLDAGFTVLPVNPDLVARRRGPAKKKDDAEDARICSLLRSRWARQFYDSKIAAGKSHNTALRALAKRWLEILWHCLRLGVTYDENIHTANRQNITLAA
jgi:transposase